MFFQSPHNVGYLSFCYTVTLFDENVHLQSLTQSLASDLLTLSTVQCTKVWQAAIYPIADNAWEHEILSKFQTANVYVTRNSDG